MVIRKYKQRCQVTTILKRVQSRKHSLPPGHPIIYCKIKLFKMAAVSVKRSITVALCGMVAVRETRTTLTGKIIAGRKATDADIQQTLKWPSLQCRREYQKCIQGYKCINGLAPAYLLDDFHSSEQIHNYNTRNRDLIRLPLGKTTKFQTSFKYNAAKSWNTLPHTTS